MGLNIIDPFGRALIMCTPYFLLLVNSFLTDLLLSSALALLHTHGVGNIIVYFPNIRFATQKGVSARLLMLTTAAWAWNGYQLGLRDLVPVSLLIFVTSQFELPPFSRTASFARFGPDLRSAWLESVLDLELSQSQSQDSDHLEEAS